jgi:hypothetical protein
VNKNPGMTSVIPGFLALKHKNRPRNKNAAGEYRYKNHAIENSSVFRDLPIDMANVCLYTNINGKRLP